MGRIAIVPEDVHSRAEFLACLGIPLEYMGDFTVLGIVVDRYPEAVDVARDKGFIVDCLSGGVLVEFTRTSAVAALIQELALHGIRSQYQDIADTFYQA